ncbi:hypothetical protein [Lactobacillus terrae]|uniref:hypothetical protein n=1 Tax=Lactobacillus terrae TaxID=2269374 RepID=UPI000C1B71BB|nr:hypothetical protein [Lactobacillus terrae]
MSRNDVEMLNYAYSFFEKYEQILKSNREYRNKVIELQLSKITWGNILIPFTTNKIVIALIYIFLIYLILGLLSSFTGLVEFLVIFGIYFYFMRKHMIKKNNNNDLQSELIKDKIKDNDDDKRSLVHKMNEEYPDILKIPEEYQTSNAVSKIKGYIDSYQANNLQEAYAIMREETFREKQEQRVIDNQKRNEQQMRELKESKNRANKKLQKSQDKSNREMNEILGSINNNLTDMRYRRK